jgi:hypothetical protein
MRTTHDCMCKGIVERARGNDYDNNILDVFLDVSSYSMHLYKKAI